MSVFFAGVHRFNPDDEPPPPQPPEYDGCFNRDGIFNDVALDDSTHGEPFGLYNPPRGHDCLRYCPILLSHFGHIICDP